MIYSTMTVAIIRTLHELGVIIENIDNSKLYPVFYRSVPEFSVKKSVDNEDIANKYLARKFKETMIGTGGECEVKVKIRKGETWTEEMGIDAVIKFDQAYRYIRNEG